MQRIVGVPRQLDAHHGTKYRSTPVAGSWENSVETQFRKPAVYNYAHSPALPRSGALAASLSPTLGHSAVLHFKLHFDAPSREWQLPRVTGGGGGGREMMDLAGLRVTAIRRYLFLRSPYPITVKIHFGIRFLRMPFIVPLMD